MGNTRPAHKTGGVDIGFVFFLGLLDTVGGHEDGPGKSGKFLGLVLPGGPVMSVEMIVFFQLRIAVAGEHFAMGVDIDPLPLALFQNFFQVF